MERRNTVEFYNKTALQRDRSRDFGPVKKLGKDINDFIKEIQKHLKDGMKVIDIGCGPGRVFMELYRTTDKKIKIFAIDNSPSMVELAKEKSKGIEDISVSLMDALKMEFEDNIFDIGINRLAASPEMYKETYRIIKKSGLFFLFVSDDDDWKEIIEHFGFMKSLGSKRHVEALKEAGFKIIKIIDFPTVGYYRDIDSLAKTIEIIPFKPPFNREEQSEKLKEYERKYRTEWGIKVSEKKVLIISEK